MADKLWCDLKTDEDKAKFLRSGEAWDTGIIAKALVNEVAEAFEFRASIASQNAIKAEEQSQCTHSYQDMPVCVHCGMDLPYS